MGKSSLREDGDKYSELQPLSAILVQFKCCLFNSLLKLHKKFQNKKKLVNFFKPFNLKKITGAVCVYNTYQLTVINILGFVCSSLTFSKEFGTVMTHGEVM